MIAAAADAGGPGLTMTVREYCAATGEGEHAVRQDLRAGKIPHVLSGRRGLVKILRKPALARMGLSGELDSGSTDSLTTQES
ncbi:MAG TPA: hypothetical protein VIW73_08655 [Candidatus Cybelea sp.]